MKISPIDEFLNEIDRITKESHIDEYEAEPENETEYICSRRFDDLARSLRCGMSADDKFQLISLVFNHQAISAYLCGFDRLVFIDCYALIDKTSEMIYNKNKYTGRKDREPYINFLSSYGNLEYTAQNINKINDMRMIRNGMAHHDPKMINRVINGFLGSDIGWMESFVFDENSTATKLNPVESILITIISHAELLKFQHNSHG